MGLGLLGRGVGDVKFLAECGAELIVTDHKTRRELAPSLKALGRFQKKITFVFGRHRFEDFENRDMILKAAGVSTDSPFIAHAREKGIPIEMSTSLFARLTPATIIGITGTRGKSTVTNMVHHILTSAHRHRSLRIFLGGNVQGVATLPFLSVARKGDIVVLELDSWQLQGFGEAHISPHVAVFTTFFDDHLNYYKGDRALYLADKANIFLNQTSSDHLIVGRQAWSKVIKTYAKKISSHIVVSDQHDLPEAWKLVVLGEHNRYNAALALSTARALGISDAVSRRALESFNGVSGRLELVRTVCSVKIYNDTTATTPEATIAGLTALGDVRAGDKKTNQTILIMGGSDKGLHMSGFIKAISRCCKVVILLPGSGTEKFLQLESLKKIIRVGATVVVEAKNLSDAVTLAMKNVERNDSILFSPAFASFGTFKNEYDRGDQFNALVSKLR